MLDAFPREKHGQALAIFGLGIMVAPVLGPVLGGWLTDTFVWRAVFYINVPIGLIALLLSMGELPRVPVRHLKTDWTGMVLLVLTVGSLQLVLDQGPTRDWFDSRFIQIFESWALPGQLSCRAVPRMMGSALVTTEKVRSSNTAPSGSTRPRCGFFPPWS